jgi:hypothetical protein
MRSQPPIFVAVSAILENSRSWESFYLCPDIYIRQINLRMSATSLCHRYMGLEIRNRLGPDKVDKMTYIQRNSCALHPLPPQFVLRLVVPRY